MFTTSTPPATSILAAFALALLPLSAVAAEDNGDDDYGMGQFQSDCEAAGGEVTWTEGTVICDFEGDEEDIICSDTLGAGGLDISSCQLGWVVERGAGDATGLRPGTGRVIKAPGGVEIQLTGEHLKGPQLRLLLQEKAR